VSRVGRQAPRPWADRDFDSFYRAEFRPVMKFLLWLGATVPDAADACGHAFTEVFARWDSIQQPARYVRRVARNEWTRLAERPRTDAERAYRASWAIEVVEDAYYQEEVQRVLAALSKLPPRQREVMAWHYDGYGAAEIADLLDMKVETVYSNLRHAKNTLRRLIVLQGDDRA
jgi:RNA polymerase sigma-70 factor (ECF subfamily)